MFPLTFNFPAPAPVGVRLALSATHKPLITKCKSDQMFHANVPRILISLPFVFHDSVFAHGPLGPNVFLLFKLLRE